MASMVDWGEEEDWWPKTTGGRDGGLVASMVDWGEEEDWWLKTTGG